MGRRRTRTKRASVRAQKVHIGAVPKKKRVQSCNRLRFGKHWVNREELSFSRFPCWEFCVSFRYFSPCWRRSFSLLNKPTAPKTAHTTRRQWIKKTAKRPHPSPPNPPPPSVTRIPDAELVPQLYCVSDSARSWFAGLPSGQPRRRLAEGALAFYRPLHGARPSRPGYLCAAAGGGCYWRRFGERSSGSGFFVSYATPEVALSIEESTCEVDDGAGAQDMCMCMHMHMWLRASLTRSLRTWSPWVEDRETYSNKHEKQHCVKEHLRCGVTT